MRKSALILISAFLLALPSVCQDTPPTPSEKQTPDAPAAKPAAAAPSSSFGLEDGTPVRLRTNHAVSPAHVKAGESLDFEVVEDVSLGGLVVIPSGGIAWATITEAPAETPGSKKPAFDIHIDTVRLANGEKAPLRAIKKIKRAEASPGGVDSTSLVFVRSAPLSSFGHGKEVSKGTPVTAYINGAMPLELAKFEKRKSEAADASQPESDTPVNFHVDISSNPAGAEIEIDGKSLGNTPATLVVPAGEHAIQITKKGYKPWDRKINLTGEGVKLAAELEVSE